MIKLNFYARLSIIAFLAVGTAIFISRAFRAVNPEGKLAVLPANTGYLSIPGIKEIQGYKKWRQVTKAPLPFVRIDPARCSPLPMRPIEAMAWNPDNPHSNKFFTVYVNPIGEKTMLSNEKKSFPVGSIIVKEKLPSKTSTSPELLTVMVKRKPGFNSKNGDWEYWGLNGTATKVEGRGKLANCQGCHTAVARTDYVFGDYLKMDEVGT